MLIFVGFAGRSVGRIVASRGALQSSHRLNCYGPFPDLSFALGPCRNLGVLSLRRVENQNC